MSRKELARRLVLQKAILDQLGAADAVDRREARVEYESGDADTVRVDGAEFGRVRRDKGRRSFRVTDPAKFELWVQQVVPDEWVSVPQVNPVFKAAILKAGEYVDADGVVHNPDGVEMFLSEGNLVVTPTEAATEWAMQIVGAQLGELE